MDGQRYVTKGYSNYTNLPAQEGGYAYGPEHVNWYMVETTTVERVRVPAIGYTKFGGAPLKNELLKGHMPKYALKDHHEGYELYYESDYENSSPPRYHEGGNLMSNFLNKIQIGASRPTKTTNILSLNKYRPTSPNKDRPRSPNKYQPTSPDKYQPTSPNKYRPISPNKYRHTSPNKNRPTSPNKYRPKSPTHNYPSKEPHLIKAQKFSGPNKYQPTSQTKYQPTSPTKYRPTSPTKYRPTSPTKYRPTSPTKYMPTSPTHSYPSKEDHIISHQNLPGLNKYRSTSPVYTFPSKKGQLIPTESFSGPNKNNPSSPGTEEGRHIRLIDFSSPYNNWQGASPPITRHPLMAPTNNINEALSFLVESVNYSPQIDPKKAGSFDNLSPRAQPTENERRYARPTFRDTTTRPFFKSNTIDSREAVRRYNGAYVP